MNEIKIHCVYCGQSLEAETDMAGEAIECPTCKKTITIPPSHRFKKIDSKMIIALQAAADYLSYNLALKRVRGGEAVGSIIFGAIALIVGLAGMQQHFLSGILALLGLFLLVEGIWIVSAPNPLGILIDGIALISVGLWNIIMAGLWGIANYHEWLIRGVLILGILQIVWGIESIKRYIRFFRISPTIPTAESAMLIDEIVRFVVDADPRHNKDMVDFIERCLPMDREWKGILTNGMGIFVLGDGEDVLVANKDQVIFPKKRKLFMPSSRIVSFRIGKRKMHGYISTESFRKFEEWADPELCLRRIQDSKTKMDAEAERIKQTQIEFASRFPIGRYDPILFKHFGHRIDRMSAESDSAYAKRLQRFARDYENETGKRLGI